jgi:hypothetical protein
MLVRLMGVLAGSGAGGGVARGPPGVTAPPPGAPAGTRLVEVGDGLPPPEALLRLPTAPPVAEATAEV